MNNPNWLQNCVTATEAFEHAQTRKAVAEKEGERAGELMILFDDGTIIHACSCYEEDYSEDTPGQGLTPPGFYLEVPYQVGLRMQAAGTIGKLIPETPFSKVEFTL